MDKTNPLKKPEEVAKNPDPNIEKDHKDFPGGEPKEEVINPQTEEEKKVANLDKENDPAP